MRPGPADRTVETEPIVLVPGDPRGRRLHHPGARRARWRVLGL